MADTPAQVPASEQKLEEKKAEPSVLIELKNVTRTYKLGDETLHALNNVSFTVRPGDFVAIMGPSGSGKSTLANIIGGLDKPSGGTVVVDGQDLSHTRDRKLSDYRNAHIGFVFQAFNLQGNSTAIENVMLPLVFARMRKGARKKRAAECLQAVGLGVRRPTPAGGDCARPGQ